MSYIPLATVTLGGSDSDIVFSNIPATFKDLVLVCSVRNTTSPSNVYARYNSDTGSNYSTVYMKGNGSSASSGGGTNNVDYIGVAYTSAPDPIVVQIMDYAATDKHKTILSRYGDAGGEGAVARANRWASTSAITSILVAVDGNNFATGSTFSLYGVA